MQYRVLKNLVQIEPLPSADAFDVSDIEYARVVAKGKECSAEYNVGDIIGYIKKTAYHGENIVFIFDDNVLMVRAND